MLVQHLIENVAALIVTGSLLANNVTGSNGTGSWQVHKGIENNQMMFPCVKVICGDFVEDYPYLKIGTGKAELELLTCALKPTRQGLNTSATEFETVSDYVFNPFLADNIASSMSLNNLKVLCVTDSGLNVVNMDDGWIATQKLTVVCQRTY
jgi:hypothetical protein